MPQLTEALVYTRPNGLRPPWAIFPLRGKFPAISKEKGGHGCHDATTDPATITQWWSQYPDANIGLATGEINGILVLDIDRNHGDGVDGTETLQELERELGKLPDSVEALTPNGGRHLFFKYPDGYDIGIHKAEKSDKWPGIDIRGNGGYVVAAPSWIRCTDRKTRAYEWEASSYPNETEMAELPEPWLKWLNKLCGRFILPAADTVKKGTRNDTLISYAGQLRAKGADKETIMAKLTEYNRQLSEPLPDKEVAAICTSALRYSPNENQGEQKIRTRMTREILNSAMQAMGYSVRYNLITCAYEITGKTPGGRTMNQDDLCTLMHDTLAGEYKGCTFDTIQQYVTFEARENSYNPVLKLLESTVWDGVDRLPQLYDLVGIASDELSKTLVYKWLLQTIALLYNSTEAPFGADGCLVLNGKELGIERNQGAGKTQFFSHLALREDWFGEGCSIDDHDKDTSRRVVTKWISELGEVESTLKSDISKLKAFITATMDAYRLPYGKSDTIAPRHTSLCATCNSDRYLIDTTGNRRWWTVPLKRVMPRAELLALDALQLWAQIFATVQPMTHTEKAACYRLTPSELTALAARNTEFEKPSKGQDEVADILVKADRDHLEVKTMTISEFKEEWPVLRPYASNQISVALKRCGVELKRTKNGSVAELPLRPMSWRS